MQNTAKLAYPFFETKDNVASDLKNYEANQTRGEKDYGQGLKPFMGFVFW